MSRQEAFFPGTGKVVRLSDRDRRTNSSAARQRNLQKIQNATDGYLVILSKILVFDTERIDPNPAEKCIRGIYLVFALLETLFNQFIGARRFVLDGFAIR